MTAFPLRTAAKPCDTKSTTSQSEMKKCCCNIPLRTRFFIIGYLNLILSSFKALYYLAFFAFLGVSSHWFHHFDFDFSQPNTIDVWGPERGTIHKPWFTREDIMILLGVVCANVAFWVTNVVYIVGLHKRRGSPTMYIVYLTVATVRLILNSSGLCYSFLPGNGKTQAIVSSCIDIGLAIYFMVVYCIYAKPPKHEQIKNKEMTQTNPHDVESVYPSTSEKF